jgi:transcription elongation factor GreA
VPQKSKKGKIKMADIYLTKKGLEKIKEELNQLYKEKNELNKEIQETKEQGDLSENAGYQYAKEKQNMIIKRISELEDLLRKAKIVDDSEINKNEVRIGAKIKIIDTKTNEEKTFQLVSMPEADPINARISVNSPLAQALLGAKLDEVRKVKLPNGMEKEYKIVSIEY